MSSTTPVEWPVEAGKGYQAVFEKDGYATATRDFDPASEPPDGGGKVMIAVVMEREATAIKDPPKVVRDPPKVIRDPPKVIKDQPESKEPGFLTIGSKPPCKIYIDGKDTGLETPQLIPGLPLRCLREGPQVLEAGADPPEWLVRHG